ncbi:hypothetical protein TWF225_011422 [Orbilia oligospora]|nr:hypothetical protein TWF225_011422 [Orbilia oligospora]KAF3235887.1 hypothetical protein TWF128_001721 [Orbilia oligospora]KAF3264748.1 hypothetical protein TWF217_002935 [Orbilia oligospora]KAF3281061.1 hypothetical protein TWF132_011371 [Orbilia oligospora]
MTIHATAFALPTRQSANWAEANKRVIQSYRLWQRAAPEIIKLYLMDIDVAAVRSKIRQEYERHRHVKDIGTVDVLLMKNQMEFQETMNYWKQLPHLMNYFRSEQEPNSHIPKNFMDNFLQGRN